MSLREAMQPYINALTDAINLGNWHLALMPALTLPDICSTLDGRGQGGKAYIAWFDEYSEGTNFNPTLYSRVGIDNIKNLQEYKELLKRKPLTPDMTKSYNRKLLSGVNVYVLRCCFLHNGDANLSEQDIYKKNKYPHATLGINKIKFISDGVRSSQQIGDAEVESVKIYEQIGDVVELNAKSFCEEILACVEKWIVAKENTPDVIERAKKLVRFIG